MFVRTGKQMEQVLRPGLDASRPSPGFGRNRHMNGSDTPLLFTRGPSTYASACLCNACARSMCPAPARIISGGHASTPTWAIWIIECCRSS